LVAPKGAVFILKAYLKRSILGCTTTLHDSSWNSLPKDMIDIHVTPAIGSIHPFVPKFLNAVNEFFFCSGLDF